ncbi:MFS transporter [Pengzhenrongella sicca]|uniref:MFS transporter n=1 Tax=Pengzhenrongella sicca TaxID=2819238 RepID=A0A8A4ZHS2_9MICO|nr:MFS transporter [Pengzhenrongella sicca]QTE30815.1 MFS transporter [Pengzhenrongella sicca]
MTTSSGSSPIDRITVRALVVWGSALAAYVFAVFARSSLSATGVEAAVRFEATAAVLSLFAVLQLGVYAVMQIPAGATVDRIGPRRAIAIGSLLIGLGQIAIAFAGGVPAAIGARVLVGSGDAFIFLSVVRLVPAWFPGRHVALVTQLTGVVGQLGQLLSLGPLVAAVHTRGWTAAFFGAGSLTLLVGLLALLAVRDGRSHQILAVAALDRAVGRAGDLAARSAPDRGGLLLRTWRNPGTRTGFWVHFTMQFSANTFALLWGFAYMTKAEHVDASVGLGVLTTYVLGCVVFGPFLGVLSGRFPGLRLRLIVTLVGVHVAMWGVVLAWPGDVPTPALFALAVVLATGGPASLIGFDICRSTNPLASMGLATGMVNAGGFTSSLTAVLAIGVVLDLLGQGSPDQFTDAGFALAWLVQVPLWALGLVMLRRSIGPYRAFGGAPAAVPPTRP